MREDSTGNGGSTMKLEPFINDDLKMTMNEEDGKGKEYIEV